MANTQAANVLRVDTNASFSGSFTIGSIRFVGASSASAYITEAASGNKVWEESGSANSHSADVDIYCRSGFSVTVASGAVVYIYLE